MEKRKYFIDRKFFQHFMIKKKMSSLTSLILMTSYQAVGVSRGEEKKSECQEPGVSLWKAFVHSSDIGNC